VRDDEKLRKFPHLFAAKVMYALGIKYKAQENHGRSNGTIFDPLGLPKPPLEFDKYCVELQQPNS
jgi:hypothetical protein